MTHYNAAFAFYTGALFLERHTCIETVYFVYWLVYWSEDCHHPLRGRIHRSSFLTDFDTPVMVVMLLPRHVERLLLLVR